MQALLLFTAFSTGASIMVIELVGSRLIAPYVGTSIFVWTSLIGIVLASLSVGYIVGGRLADKNAKIITLSYILFASSITTAGIIIAIPIIYNLGLLSTGLTFGSIISASLVFVPSTFFLGMVTPYIARLNITDVATSGKTIGNLYATSTIGSIVGTFSGGFILISFFGSTKIILGTALALLLLSVILGLINRRHEKTILTQTTIGIIIFLFGLSVPSSAPVQGTLLYDGDTPYHRIWIYDSFEQKTGKPARFFTDTIHGYHSAIYTETEDELVQDYTTYFELSDYFIPSASRYLMIGGAVQAYPSYLAKKYPNRHIDSIEIDPNLLPLARTYFNYVDRPNLTPIHADGRIFLNNATTSYDVIFIDAFSSLLAVPFQLTTTEAVSHLKRLLNTQGVVIVNFISAIDGPGGNLFRSLYATYKNHFSHVYTFKRSPYGMDGPNDKIMNIILIATNNKEAPRPPFATNTPWKDELDTYYAGDIMSGPILTDNFAPVERYVTQAFLEI